MKNLPDEIINKILTYIESNTNQIMKSFLKLNSHSHKDFTTLTKNIKRNLSFPYTDYLYTNYFSTTYKRCKIFGNLILLKRGILTNYIKYSNKRRKKSGTKKFFIQSQKDYLLRKINIDCAFGYCCERLYNRGPLLNYEKMYICNECKISLNEIKSKKIKKDILNLK